MYIGGSFTIAGGNPANYIAKWNTPPSAIKDNEANNKLNIFPNPSSNVITVELKEYTSSKLQITDTKGQICMELKIDSQNTNVNLSALPKGMYFVTISNENTTIIKKIIKD